MVGEEKEEENTRGKTCPLCTKGKIGENYKCDNCEINLIEFNLARRSALLDYYGTGMSTHAGIMAGISFALFSMLQILLNKDIAGLTFWLTYLISAGFQLAVGYVILRFIRYRNGGMQNENVILSWGKLRYIFEKIPKELKEREWKGDHFSEMIVRKYITKNFKIAYGIFLLFYNGIIIVERNSCVIELMKYLFS